MLPFDDLPSLCFCDGEVHLFVACFSFIPYFIMVPTAEQHQWGGGLSYFFLLELLQQIHVYVESVLVRTDYNNVF
jgi:hypothetical protein